MKFLTPAPEELSSLRADPLLWEQELDVRPDVAEAIERAAGLRAGKVYWRSPHDHLYCLELFDAGRGRPSMAVVYGHWDRYEPRPPEHEIDVDLLALSVWVAGISSSLNPADVVKVARFAGVEAGWPQGTVRSTPPDRFANLPGFSHESKYALVEGLRMAYVEQGAGDPILLLHGEPAWGYLYRRMLPPLAAAGRAIAPDLIGFGRSDKPVAANAHTYKSHTRWLRQWVESLELQRITLVCHGSGGVVGLRLLAQMPERFARVVAMNTGLPDGRDPGEAFLKWRRFSQTAPALEPASLIQSTLRRRRLSDSEAAAYNAPFPAPDFQIAALTLPRLVPARPDDAGAYENRLAIERLKTLDVPALLLQSDRDDLTTAWMDPLRHVFRNARRPIAIAGAGHFLPEDAGEEAAGHVLRFIEGE